MANVVLVGALVRRRSTSQVLVATGVIAFSQGTIRSSQTVLSSPSWCWPSSARSSSSWRESSHDIITSALVVWVSCSGWREPPRSGPSSAGGGTGDPVASGVRARGKVVGGACRWVLCLLAPLPDREPRRRSSARSSSPKPSGTPAALLPSPARRSHRDPRTLLRLRTVGHRRLGACHARPSSSRLIGAALSAGAPGRAAWSTPGATRLCGALLVAAGLLLSPTYYYHYSAFMAPFWL